MIETERCIIKPIHWDHFDRYVQESMDPLVVQYTGDKDIVSKEEHKAKWEAKLRYMAENPGFGSFSVFLKSNNQQIGGCNVNELENTGLKHLGYRIYRDFWGMGIGTEVARAARDYALGTMKLDLITAVVNEENLTSRKVLDKIKMRYIGERRLYEMDLMYYELTREEYEQL